MPDNPNIRRQPETNLTLWTSSYRRPSERAVGSQFSRSGHGIVVFTSVAAYSPPAYQSARERHVETEGRE